MKISKDWVLTELGNEYVMVPVGENSSTLSGIIKLNESGKDIFNELLENKSIEEIANKLVNEYEDLSYKKALEAVNKVVEKLYEEGILEK